MNSANSHFFGEGLISGQRRVSAVSVFKHLQKRLAALNGVQQHLEMQNYHSIYLRVTKIDVIPRKTYRFAKESEQWNTEKSYVDHSLVQNRNETRQRATI